MQAVYYDPMFYLCSAEMPFTIRIEVTFRTPIDPDALSEAANAAVRRYPYFAVQVVSEDGELHCAPNPRPLIVYPGPEVRPLGSEAVNRHLLAFGYEGKLLCLYASHVITDGAGLFPYIKTMLYEYLSRVCPEKPDPAGLPMVDSPFFPDELGNPFPEAKMAAASPLYLAPQSDFFRLRDGGYVTDSRRTVYRFRVRESEVMAYNLDHDGSPCALFSSLMAKAIWALHPENEKEIVSAVSFNLRPGLGNGYSWRMLCSSIPLRYPARLRDAETVKLCTCSRGMVTLLSQPENVLYYAQQTRERMEALLRLPGVAAKRAALSPAALQDSVENTFSVSYVGKMGLGSLEPHLESIYNLTDGSTYQTAFIEISSVGGWFDVAFLQGFSSDVYYRAFLRELNACGLDYIEEASSPLGTPEIELPE